MGPRVPAGQGVPAGPRVPVGPGVPAGPGVPVGLGVPEGLRWAEAGAVPAALEGWQWLFCVGGAGAPSRAPSS